MENKDNKKYHNTLNPKLWLNDKLKPEVANKLKQIAKAFIEFLDIPASAIKDIVLTGSNVSYNYTPHSDIDLHLIVDFEKVHKDCPIVGEYLLSKKSEFNQKHDIFIYGIPVEVYAEPIGNDNVHNGLYSLKYNKWLEEPKKLKQPNNSSAVNAKYKEYAEAAENVKDKDIASLLIDKIKKMRKAGLSKEGEFSVENLVFKKLRNNGIITKLMDIKKEGIDKELSLKESYEYAIEKIEEVMGMMAPSTVAMAPYPNPAVGQVEIHKETKNRKSKPAMYKYKYTKSRQSRIQPVVETIQEIANICKSMIKEEYSQSSAEYYGKKYGNYKKRKEGNPEYNIPKGNAEREQKLQNKWNAQAQETGNGDSYQQHALETHKDILNSFKQGKMSKADFIQKIKKSGKNIRKFSPGAMNNLTGEKYNASAHRSDKFKGYASDSENQ